MEFIYKTDKNGCLEYLIDGLDKDEMNWVSKTKTWGRVISKKGISFDVKRSINSKGYFNEIYSFKNISSREIFINDGDISVAISLPDKYESAEECFEHCCHVHLWCGYDVSYICALRMSGASDKRNLGMSVIQGGLSGYGIDRNKDSLSNDRGTFLLYPAVGTLLPGEEYLLETEWFWFNELSQFKNIVYSEKNAIRVTFDDYIGFLGDDISKPKIEYLNFINHDQIKVFCNNEPYENKEILGERNWDIYYDNYHTIAKTLILPQPAEILKKRCKFIALHQQFKGGNSHFDGALLSFDNETKRMFYSKEYDYNAGRERLGMGALMALYLQRDNDNQVKECLDKYTEFVKRELFDEVSGEVFNDLERDNNWNRLYNYPWVSIFFMERFNLYHDRVDALYMYKALNSYYTQEGKYFYAIGIPMVEAIEILGEASLFEEAKHLSEMFLEHAYTIADNGFNYPKSEVNYEQSIVAPAVCYLFYAYELCHDESLLLEAEKQLRVLELFNGFAPDYHLNEVAIRHWDGYWFGKRKNLGDTFPHYWSCLSAIAFLLNGKINGDEKYIIKAQKSARAVLSLFNDKGEGSCAYVYPTHINGESGQYYDPLANDQDWGLYYYIKYFYED